MCSQVVGVGVGEEEQLGVGMDGEVSLDDAFVPADEVGHVLDFDLRLRTVPTEGVAAGIAGGSESCGGEKKPWLTCGLHGWQARLIYYRIKACQTSALVIYNDKNNAWNYVGGQVESGENAHIQKSLQSPSGLFIMRLLTL